MLRDELSSELGKVVYDYSPITKLTLPPEIAKELSEAFCIREGYTLVSYSDEPLGIHSVEIEAEEESLELYSKWRFAFREHGYSPPFLGIKIDSDDD